MSRDPRPTIAGTGAGKDIEAQMIDQRVESVGPRVSRGEISRICAGLDEQVEAFGRDHDRLVIESHATGHRARPRAQLGALIKSAAEPPYTLR